MPELDDMQNHWRDLAAQLGLPPSEEAAPRAKAPRQENIQPPPLPPRAEEPAELADVLEQSETIPTAEAEPMPAEESAPPDRPRRGSRGRRRGRRGDRFAEAASDTSESATDETAPPAEGEESAAAERTHRRGRGRPRPEPAPIEEEEAAVEEEVESQESPSAIEEGDEEDTDDMSGWEIPSWQELIDSLYRPDR